MKKYKEVTSRIKEMVEIRKKLDELGFNRDHEQVSELYKKMDCFVHGEGFSGKVVLSDFGRVAICKFSLQPHCVSTMILRQIHNA